ncbi:methyl-accepting chemotaxis protein [Novosphingobium sp. PhB165]|uniref:hypothetical protein n=1 Tax=Novosphingobium sp. PhB165 TaxID=2485105 RepID=UPI0010F2986B|nr:hypothetical protein [Novosphingobium sp. PhB165]TCM16471.1 methyl-accepting chemotaxis protein [Novosphingobium sp. PhB165]
MTTICFPEPVSDDPATTGLEDALFLATISEDSLEAAPARMELRDALATVASGLDARFVAAGTALARAYEIVEALIGALESVTNAFERDAAEAAVDNMRGTADRLMRLPVIQSSRRKALISIEQASAALSGQIDQVNRTLSFLRICGLNIKVAAAGSGDFSGFADMMFAKIDLGEEEMASISREIGWLAEAVPGMFEVEDQLAAECALVVPQVPCKLADDALALQDHQVDLAERAVQISDVARRIRSQVGTALGALQVGDITRQRLEHVADGLLDLDTFLEAPSDLTPDVLEIIAGHATALLAAQAADTLDIFRNEARLLTSSLRGIGPNAAALLELRVSENADEPDGEGVFLQMLETSVAEVASVTERLREADARSNRLSNVASTTARNLAKRLATVHRITSDVQQMAWNTDLRCYRMGTEGRGLAVVAAEIRGFAATLATIASAIAQSFDGLTAAAATIGGTEEDEPVDAGQALKESLDCIRDGGQRMRRGLSELDHGASAVAEILQETTDRIDCEAEVGDPLLEIADRLAVLGQECADVPEEAVAALGDLLGTIAARYTMAREREVHRAFMPNASEDAAPTVDMFDDDDDDFDDGLF